MLLPCATRGVPEPRVSWSRDGAPVRGGGGKATVLPSGELLLQDVQVSTIPSYGRASCDVGELENKCLLLLKRKPRLFCALLCPWAGAGSILPAFKNIWQRKSPVQSCATGWQVRAA